ncbi:endonuclease/exonuclease/phosphatase family protein [Maricaulis sp.]|uniref:endonuclease/exonuclease/phosphatase family protein n=1 Tax=Maricaulis sp. TaxID=1486257 RepID=UPI002B268307|nr:endonuclease/exonuclease/phosphatase family protein [Maricaulis sp.]
MRHTITAFLASCAVLGLAAFITLAPLWRGFDAWRHIWPLVAIFVVAVTLFSLRNRHRWLPIVLGAGCVLVLLPAGPEAWRRLSLSAPGENADSVTDLTMVTHNLWGLNTNPVEAPAVLAALAPDILALQEATRHAEPVVDQLEAAFPHVARCRSVRVLSRLPMLDSGCVRHPQEISFENAVPCDWELPPAVWARIELPDSRQAMIVSVHLTWPFPTAAQDCQRRNLARALAREAQDTLIVMGDFNAAAPSRALARIERDLALERRSIALPSWPSEGLFSTDPSAGFLVPPMLVGIDHIFAGEAWETESIKAGPNTGSDHRPLVARLRLRAPVDQS